MSGETLTDAKLNVLVEVAQGGVTAVIAGKWHVWGEKATPGQARALNWLDGDFIERVEGGRYRATDQGIESLRLYRNWR